MVLVLSILLGVITLGWVMACVQLYLQQGRLLFPGDGQDFGGFDALHALSGEAVSVERDGQVLRYYQVPAAGGLSPKGWVLHFHGNRQGARERFDFAENFSRWGYASILAEYPGYAGDPQLGSQRLLLRNGLCLADEAQRLSAGAPLFFFGESLGSAVATFAAQRRQPQGLLLSTPFSSLAAVAKARYPWMPVHQLISDPMPSKDWAPHVKCPVFIVHGQLDQTVPYAEGLVQARNFWPKPDFNSIAGPGHSDIRDLFPEQYWGSVHRFLDRCLPK